MTKKSRRSRDSQLISIKDPQGRKYNAILVINQGGIEIHKLEEVAVERSTDPEAGVQRFYVACEKLSCYTSIGADNRHHASNKATKLFGPHWSQITQDAHFTRGYQFYKVGEFSELIRTLQN